MIVSGNDSITIIGQLNTILGCSSGDWGTLCTWNGINKWARRKPIRNANPGILVEQDFVDANFGLELPIARPDMIDAVTLSGFNYLKPQGAAINEWYRILDFNGYNHSALAVVRALDASEKIKDVDYDTVTFEILFEDQGDPDAEISFSEIAANIQKTRGIDITTWYLAFGIVRNSILYYHTEDTQIGNASSRRRRINFRTNQPPFTNIPVSGSVDCYYYICLAKNKYTYTDTQPSSNQFIAIPVSTGGETGTLSIINSAGSWSIDVSEENGHIDTQYRSQVFTAYPEYDTYKWKDIESAEVYWPIPSSNALFFGVAITNTAAVAKTLNASELSMSFETSPVNWVSRRGTGQVHPNIAYYFDARSSGIGTSFTTLNLASGQTKYLLLGFYDFWKYYLDAQGTQHSNGTPIAGSTGTSGTMGYVYYRDTVIGSFRMNLKKI